MTKRWILWNVLTLHLAWGIIGLLSPEPLMATPKGEILRFFGNDFYAEIAMILASLMALKALLD